MASFAFEHGPVASGHLIVASGELDVTAVDEMSTLFAMAIAGTRGAVIMDLSRVHFVDSTALATLLQGARELRRVGKRLLVVAADGPVRSLLEITGLAQSFTLRETRADAIADADQRADSG
ncbi:MAG: hypothetical protein AVDCRST_MAG38-2956 [uncultured Solirubrobacteraceae bacterium]|uniref:Anti-sigma factor antagonist n=1 Tax=uncultured Solirubrobacteraceae bacterium TaxID=1162706 RepID=A0A6J4SME2_9ACTN|nr:MAG: hypothetical protein AVDCRST_MAG38-2956 [uncultured Solirubrobacteraceae bacterium]